MVASSDNIARILGRAAQKRKRSENMQICASGPSEFAATPRSTPRTPTDSSSTARMQGGHSARSAEPRQNRTGCNQDVTCNGGPARRRGSATAGRAGNHSRRRLKPAQWSLFLRPVVSASEALARALRRAVPGQPAGRLSYECYPGVCRIGKPPSYPALQAELAASGGNVKAASRCGGAGHVCQGARVQA